KRHGSKTPPIPSPASGRGGGPTRPQLAFEQASVGRFFSCAYFLAASTTIGHTTFWSESIQSETNLHSFPSHWCTLARAMPVWFSHVTLSVVSRPLKPSLSSLSAVRSRFSSPQRTCSPVSGLLPNFAWEVRTASVANSALIIPRL